MREHRCPYRAEPDAEDAERHGIDGGDDDADEPLFAVRDGEQRRRAEWGDDDGDPARAEQLSRPGHSRSQ
jgi:hypothetical protein